MGRSEDRAAVVAREDLVMFINACFACTGQREFYGGGEGVGIEFLHQYTLGNYRRLYARTLAAGINHFNQGLIVQNLLAAGSPQAREQRAEEGELIAAALRSLPANRAYGVIGALRRRRVNNRRTRAVLRRFLESRRDLTFDAVKYRRRLAAAAAHAHLRLEGELGPFLFELERQRRFATPLLETYREARYSRAAVFALPFSVAEGFAGRHGIDRAELLERSQGQMTAAERARLRENAERLGADLDAGDLSALPLTKLALYALSRPPAERARRAGELEAALAAAAARVARQRAFTGLGRVAAVLDSSFSSVGTRARHLRPLAVALAVSALLRAAARDYRPFWTSPGERELLLEPRGPTDLATPLVEALATRPELVLIVSDGFENDPPAAAAEVLRVFRERLDPAGAVEVVHLNPVFDAVHYEPRRLSAAAPTVGLRDAEDLPTMLGFARFASGDASLGELEAYLARRAEAFLEEARS